jgi:alpha-tubulin suppressor-like RCC1 family protein
MCWGTDDFVDGGRLRITPVEAWKLEETPLAMRIGGSYACVLLRSGGVKCTGRNDFGQLGNGMTADSPEIPVDVGGLEGASYLSAGSRHACAMLPSGGVRCWGDNGYWQLANNAASFASVPADVGLSSIHFYYSGIEAAAPPATKPQKYVSIWT